MGPFQFRLARVLTWRNNQLQLGKNQLAASYAALARVSQKMEELRVSQLRTERALLALPSIDAADLQALVENRRCVRAQDIQLRDDVRRCEREIWLNLESLKKAQLRVHLLEKLQQRRMAEHTYLANRELEELAADTYLAKFAREM